MHNFDEYIDFIKRHFNEEYDDKYNNEYINNKLKKKLKNINDDIAIKIGKKIKLIFQIDDNRFIKYNDIELLYVNDDIKIQYYNWSHNININYKDIYNVFLSINDHKIIQLLDNIIENEEDRNKGIGTEGMKKTLNFLKNSGYCKIYGKMSGDLEGLKKFYSKIGFEIYGENIQYFFCERLKKTNELLKIYDKDIRILNISNKNIEGILDLNEFKSLEELDCSNNKITEIINFPTIDYCNVKNISFKYLNCSNNLINKLNNLPLSMTGLNCKKNPLKELYYPFNIKPNKYPSNLIYLKFGNGFNQQINNLPNSLINLTLGLNFNQTLDNLPNSITHIIFSSSSGKYSNYSSFNQLLNNLPNSLTNLVLPDSYNIEINDLPNSLKYITFGGFYDKSINNLPDNIETIIFDNILCRDYDGKYNGYEYSYPRICNIDVKKLPSNINNIVIFDDNFNRIDIFNKHLIITSSLYSEEYCIDIYNEYDIKDNLNNLNKIHNYLSKIQHFDIEIHNHNVPTKFGGEKNPNINKIIENKNKFINHCLKIIDKYKFNEYFKYNYILYPQNNLNINHS